ncbi:helix-turn-helix transcriptional regulator [Paraneptunicella aestuarii]|uniref:helix-turn-helix domain-containing protein n=1 Tax=Paraneptunicella aestuarii TaxID=2831148 RepID=UPI001E5A4E2F|nr:helix-turn-helix transcriptional regulator [Paraneptunicella aestuarii]UAA37848.1 helix-turn-helix transcriptional regulator [Paraneptunicella aestuarii]
MKEIKGGDIKAIRQYAQMSAEQLAKAAGVTVCTFMSWERGHTAPSINQLITLLRASGIDSETYLKQVFAAQRSTLFDFFKVVQFSRVKR